MSTILGKKLGYAQSAAKEELKKEGVNAESVWTKTFLQKWDIKSKIICKGDWLWELVTQNSQSQNLKK